ncbi:ABC-ATPase domain-containing protein [Persicobacter diffluens]|uniref:ATPase n=1 Tax=Persicobacter diffluens TaxID=981 RepID=A0AAN4W2Z7_9BACT|nr:ATPase [Persicobacter diffluens]
MHKLKQLLHKIDGQSYGAYKSIKGRYEFERFDLDIIKVQGDPFASPSLLEVSFLLTDFGFEPQCWSNADRRLGLENGIHHLASDALGRGKRRGSGKSGAIQIQTVGQTMFKRSSVEVEGNKVFIKFYVGLPAAGRRVLGREAMEMLLTDIPDWVERMDLNDNGQALKMERFALTNEKAEAIRKHLKANNWLAFIQNGSVLARKSGVDDRPMEDAVKFQSPASMEVEISVLGESMKGMAIPHGITVITGGGFHGKSTLLNALEYGVYNHIPSDGRTYCITDENAVKVRAEDGRYMQGVNISPFINNLPHKKDTVNFSTENASGSTSQAGNIMEAISLGANALLIDEDTSASNFMVRDQKVQSLIKADKEPITAFIERVQDLKAAGISSVMVIGGLGDYFEVADQVLMLDEYKVKEVTAEAKAIIEKFGGHQRTVEHQADFQPFQMKLDWPRIKSHFGDRAKTKSRDLDEISVNKDNINIRSLEQLVEPAQANLIAALLAKMGKGNFGSGDLAAVATEMQEQLNQQNFEDLTGPSGNLSFVRKYEFAAAVSRWKVSEQQPQRERGGGRRYGRRH